MLRIQLAIAIFGVTLITDGKLGIPTKIPIKTSASSDHTNSISEIADCQADDQQNEAQGLPSVVANIKISLGTNRALIDQVVNLMRLCIPE